MQAECERCNRWCDYPLHRWVWVRYKGSFRDRLVCPECRKDAEGKGATVTTYS